MKKRVLLVIDGQNDFCDIPQNELPRNANGDILHQPALPVQGADEDMKRLASFIVPNIKNFTSFYFTMVKRESSRLQAGDESFIFFFGFQYIFL